MATHDRTERPEQVSAPALRSIIKMIDMAIENGSLDASDRDEVIKMFISKPTAVVDNKADGGMMNIDNMTRPLNFDVGGMAAEDEGKTFGRGEFSYDDPNLIKFIQKRADSNKTTFKEELMKFVDEVESFYRNKKANGGIVSINSLTQGL
jgi:hypothetical protein